MDSQIKSVLFNTLKLSSLYDNIVFMTWGLLIQFTTKVSQGRKIIKRIGVLPACQ